MAKSKLFDKIMIYKQNIGEKISFKSFPTNNLYELLSVICFSNNKH